MHIFRRKEVAILIPIYRIELTENEKIALSQCAKILKKYDIIIIHPNNIDIAKIKNDYQIGKAKPFDRKYFSNTNGYNRLLLTIDFYREFLQYKFILIYQLDAFVFHDSLQYWCRQDYDYVGAPWIGEAWPHAIMRNTKKPLWANNFIFRYLFFAKENFVGNGGFSLRKISSAIIALAILKKHAISWEINEDIFWSIFVRNTLPFLKYQI